MNAAQIDAALALDSDMTLTEVLASLGMTHRESKHYGCREVLRNDELLGSFNAEACVEWLKAGCPAK